MDVSQKKVVALITGASRGFGNSLARMLASTLARLNAAEVTLLLHARPTSKGKISDLSSSLTSQDSTTQFKVTPLLFDLQEKEAGAKTEAALQEATSNAHVAFLFNNAGILRATQIGSEDFASAVRENLEVNTVAAASVANAFVRAVPNSCIKRIALTTSVTSLHPFRSWAPYCSSKAAVEMIHRVIAKERGDIRVICYAPGAMGTDMISDRQSLKGTDPSLQESLHQMLATKSAVDPDESAQKLIFLLLQDRYESGQHIDFSDS